jgi:hypothetical protein
MLAPALNGVVQLDVDAQVIGVQLQLIALVETAVGVDLHGQTGQRRLELEAPVPIRRRMAVEGHGLLIALV